MLELKLNSIERVFDRFFNVMLELKLNSIELKEYLIDICNDNYYCMFMVFKKWSFGNSPVRTGVFDCNNI